MSDDDTAPQQRWKRNYGGDPEFCGWKVTLGIGQEIIRPDPTALAERDARLAAPRRAQGDPPVGYSAGERPRRQRYWQTSPSVMQRMVLITSATLNRKFKQRYQLVSLPLISLLLDPDEPA